MAAILSYMRQRRDENPTELHLINAPQKLAYHLSPNDAKVPARLGSGMLFVTEETVLPEMLSAVPKTAKSAGSRKTPKTNESDKLLKLILTSLDDDKAEDVLSIDLRGKSELADHMVIASGRSTRQVASIADNLTDRVKVGLNVSSRLEGKQAADWVLIDCGDVIVHVFRPEVREFYQLEKMWLPVAEQARRTAKPV